MSKRGVPEGDTGAVLRLVPPGEGDQSGGETTTPDTDETTTAAQDR